MPIGPRRRFHNARLRLVAHDVLRAREAWLAIVAVALLVVAWNVYRKLVGPDLFGLDAHAYWAVNLASPYQLAVGQPDAFLYAPPLAYVFGLLHALPWPVFHGLWLIVSVLALVWLAREWTPVMLALPPVFNELYFGNINLLLALAIVVGFRRPAAWAFILLTKVTPGVGLLWFGVREEWRRLAAALAATAAIAVVSFVATPGLWFDWFHSLSLNPSAPPSQTAYPIPLLPRLVAAAAILVWAGLTDRRWTVPIAVVLALPVVWSAGLSVLVALVPLLRPVFAAWLRPAAAARSMFTQARVTSR